MNAMQIYRDAMHRITLKMHCHAVMHTKGGVKTYYYYYPLRPPLPPYRLHDCMSAHIERAIVHEVPREVHDRESPPQVGLHDVRGPE